MAVSQSGIKERFGMKVNFFTFEQFHGRKHTGSGKIRVKNLIKYWDGADLYRYGNKPDVLVFQKVYVTEDYKLPISYPGIKILDVCDPDWFSYHFWLKATVDAVDAVVCPTKEMQTFIQQLTDKPVRVIKDRFDVSEFPTPKVHTKKAKDVVWFGYSHNAEILRDVVFSCYKRKLNLTIISDSDPELWQVHDEFKPYYRFKPYKQETIYEELKKADICVMPKGNRPQDRFKSENKTIIARLCGLPVAANSEELDELLEPEAREKDKSKWYDKVRAEYDCINSVNEYKQLIKELEDAKNSKG